MPFLFCSRCGSDFILGYTNREGKEAYICNRCNGDIVQRFIGTTNDFLYDGTRKEIEKAYYERLSYEEELENYIHGSKVQINNESISYQY